MSPVSCILPSTWTVWWETSRIHCTSQRKSKHNLPEFYTLLSPSLEKLEILLCPFALLNGCSPSLLSRLKCNLEHNKHTFQRKPECTGGRLHNMVLPDLKIRNKEGLSFHLNSNFYFGLVMYWPREAKELWHHSRCLFRSFG